MTGITSGSSMKITPNPPQERQMKHELKYNYNALLKKFKTHSTWLSAENHIDHCLKSLEESLKFAQVTVLQNEPGRIVFDGDVDLFRDTLGTEPGMDPDIRVLYKYLRAGAFTDAPQDPG
jgi:hypothetical protein